jgi:hypothetical protein
VDDENYIDIVHVEKGTQTDENLMDGGCKNYIRVYAFLDYAITRLGQKDEQKASDFINFLKWMDEQTDGGRLPMTKAHMAYGQVS